MTTAVQAVVRQPLPARMEHTRDEGRTSYQVLGGRSMARTQAPPSHASDRASIWLAGQRDLWDSMTYSDDREPSIAITALSRALAIAQDRFRTNVQMSVKGPTGDIVTEVDLLCEAEIVKVLKTAFPEHTILVEETQDYLTGSPWRWVVDPLDGTNNYAYGLPLWGLSIALCYEGDPVLACVADGASGSIITAIKGAGVSIDGTQLNPLKNPAPHPAAAFWIGYGINRQSATNQALLNALAKLTRRTFENWAPTVDVGLYLRGGVDLIAASNCSGTELPAALLVLREAGARLVNLRGADISLSAVPDFFLAGRPQLVDRILKELDDCRAGR
jgi:myo-inositol-1(or 4)-monophosphatase